MAEVVRVDSRDCSQPGCPEEAAWSRGPLAGLCLRCAEGKRRALSARAKETAAAVDPEVRRERARTAAAARGAAADARSSTAIRQAIRELEAALRGLELAERRELAAIERARMARAQRVAALRVVEARREDLNRAVLGGNAPRSAAS